MFYHDVFMFRDFQDFQISKVYRDFTTVKSGESVRRSQLFWIHNFELPQVQRFRADPTLFDTYQYVFQKCGFLGFTYVLRSLRFSDFQNSSRFHHRKIHWKRSEKPIVLDAKN